MLTSLMPLIMHFSTMNAAYKNYFLMFSEDIINLLSPCFADNEINDLYWNFVEDMALKEGLFPIFDTTLAGNHQIIDLPKYIFKFGTIKGWWSMAGERSISTMKAFLPSGGQQSEKTTFNKYSEWEEPTTHTAYNNQIYLDNSGNIFHRIKDDNINQQTLFTKQLDDFDKYIIIKNDQNIEELKYCDFGFTMKDNIKNIKIFDDYKNFYDDDFFILKKK